MFSSKTRQYLLLMSLLLTAAYRSSASTAAVVNTAADNIIISIVDSSDPSMFLRTTSQDKAVSFTLEDDSTEYLASVDKKAASGSVRCYTNTGKPVDLSCSYSDTHTSITITPIDWKAKEITLRFKADPDEDFFGGGEPWTGSVNQRGKRIVMSVDNSTPDRCCYVPFFMSSRGYGIFIDSYERGVAAFPKAGESGAFELSFRTLDKPSLTFHYFPGPSPKQILMNYVKLTGMPPLPPKWNFLPWVWRNEYAGWNEVFEDARGMRKHDIPCALTLIDNPWMKHGLCSFEFDPNRFPDAPTRIKELKDLGYKVMVWVAPFTNESVPNFKIAKDRNYLVKDTSGKPYLMGSGYHIDLTNPEAYSWWKEEMKKIIRLGIDGFKLDRGQDIREDARFFDGSTGASARNGYALLACKVCYEALQEVNDDQFTLMPRAGCAGSQSYSPAKWPGDMRPDFNSRSGLPAVITAAQCMSMSGFAFWGSDTGGFEPGGPDKKTFIRWSQFSCFTPVMELGGDDIHQPWHPRFAPEGLDIYRYYATLHTELLPYTYTYAVTASTTGLPIIRPLFLEYPSDKTARSRDYQCLYGQNILVAPVHTEEDRLESLYLPAGEWIDYWDWSSRIAGPKTFTNLEVPLERIPIYLRNGAIIPMEVRNDVTGHGDAYSEGKLTLLALPDGRSHFKMLDKNTSTEFWMLEKDSIVKLAWKNSPKPLLFRVRSQVPARVVSGNRAYTQVNDLKSYSGQPGTWCYDSKSMCLMLSPIEGTSDLLIYQK